MRKKVKQSAIIAIALLAIYFLITNVFIYPLKIEGMSMFPTMAPNEIKLANRWKVITNQNLNRNDIIIFEEPNRLYVSKEEFNNNHLLAEYDNDFFINPFKKKFIKRIIGLPGDNIKITEQNELYVNGEKIGFANREGYKTYLFVDLIVPENSVYVLGDNRDESVDSRSFGCIPIKKIYSVLS